MEIRQIKYFIQVCRDKSILKASQNLYISQQTLSKSMQNLENELGVALFKRSKAGIEMTKHGYIFFGKAVHIIDELNALLHELDEEKEDYLEKLSVGFTLNTLNTLYLDTIWEYQEKHKTTKVSFVETSERHCAEMVFREQLDLACVSGIGDVEPSFFDFILFRQTAPWLAISVDNPLAKKETITMADLAHENFLLGSNDFGHFHELLEVCHSWGFYPRKDYLSDNIYTLIDLVTLNKGIYILPENRLKDLYRPNVRYVLLEDIPPVKFFIITKKGRDLPSAVNSFCELLVEKEATYIPE